MMGLEDRLSIAFYCYFIVTCPLDVAMPLYTVPPLLARLLKTSKTIDTDTVVLCQIYLRVLKTMMPQQPRWVPVVPHTAPSPCF
jgi:hypothetical protein